MSETREDLDALFDAVREGIYGDDRQTMTEVGRAIDALNAIRETLDGYAARVSGIVEGNARAAISVRKQLHRLLDQYDVEPNPDVAVRIVTLGERLRDLVADVRRFFDPNRHEAIRDDAAYWRSERESDALRNRILDRLKP